MGLESYPVKFSFARSDPPRYYVLVCIRRHRTVNGCEGAYFVAVNTGHRGPSKKESVERSQENDDVVDDDKEEEAEEEKGGGKEQEKKKEGEEKETKKMLTVGLRKTSLRSLGPGVYATR